MTPITTVDINGDPKRIDDAAPSVGPPARLEDSANQEEFEPTLESVEGEHDGGKGRDKRFSGEGIVVGCEVCWVVV